MFISLFGEVVILLLCVVTLTLSPSRYIEYNSGELVHARNRLYPHSNRSYQMRYSSRTAPLLLDIHQPHHRLYRHGYSRSRNDQVPSDFRRYVWYLASTMTGYQTYKYITSSKYDNDDQLFQASLFPYPTSSSPPFRKVRNFRIHVYMS